MRGMKTVGILRELPEEKGSRWRSMGVVAAILPTTNPTSTAIYKILISLKAGNAIVLSPHPRAHQSTCSTAAILYQAAVEAGAPEASSSAWITPRSKLPTRSCGTSARA